jgi:hypothetical protein
VKLSGHKREVRIGLKSSRPEIYDEVDTSSKRCCCKAKSYTNRLGQFTGSRYNIRF